MAYSNLKKHRRLCFAICGLLSSWLMPAVGWAQVTNRPVTVQITVNSPLDGPVQPDANLTLREAIELVNGTLSLSSLSVAEQQLVQQQSEPEIRFDLPAGQTTIELASVLPAVVRPGVTLDGTTQPGYDATKSATAEIDVPIPVITIRPETGKEIFRGLTLAADDITVRGFNIYGFNATDRITRSTPPADIFISHRPIPQNRETALPAVGDRAVPQEAPSGIVIEQNWLGLTAEEEIPDVPSGFGISVFDSTGTTIRRNRIEYHNGSGIITGRQADNLEVVENIVVGNGLSGMPDAIRLDGQVKESVISNNLICGNDGSGIFLFKPDGAVTISNNDIRFNGQRLRRAAIYVMGSDHRIVDNTITHQKGEGVVVTAFGQGPNTQSQRNVITGNRFDSLEGLSIDLNARRDRAVQNFQRGDGPNPRRNSSNRRQDTGNSAVNAPQFASTEFFVIEDRAIVRGQADVGSQVQLYRSNGMVGEHGPLSEPLLVTTADESGEFEFEVDSFTGGEVLSAIATDPRYGTSEPALNTTIRTFDNNALDASTDVVATPQCTTPPVPPAPPTEESIESVLPSIPDIIQLQVPRNVHFALDKDFISAESALVLDQIAKVLRAYPSIVVDLHGHTDSRASVAYNQDLARRRAENARRYLLEQGVGSERMTIRSFGETELLVEETDRTNFARNRRVEFVFTDVRGVDITFINQEADLQIEP